MTTQKTNPGNYFEDFTVGMELVHTSPRTVTEGDAALYTALYGPRFAPTSGATVAEALGYDRMPMDSMLVFHVVFGKTVPEVSLNAVANLGYAAGTFQAPVHAGDTLSARSEVMVTSGSPQATTEVNGARSFSTLTAKPWAETPWEMWMPTEAILRSPTHTPTCLWPSRVPASRPASASAATIARSMVSTNSGTLCTRMIG